MRIFGGSTAAALCALLLSQVQAKTSWSFKDGQLQIQAKGAGNAAGVTKDLSPSSPLSKPVSVASADTLKLSLTITSGSQGSRPHQAFLSLADPATGLEDAYAFDVKPSGKATLSLAYKDIPAQLTAASTINARVILGSFGSADPLSQPVFSLAVVNDSDGNAAARASTASAPLRYGKLPELHHTFKSDPRSPPAFITLVFTAAVFTTVPVLLGVWLTLGANVAHLSEAIGKAPLAYATFVGSILGIESVLFAYYVNWKLYQVLPALGVLGVAGVLSGSRALSEVQERRLAGKR